MDHLLNKTIEEVTEFVTAHGYTLRPVKKWVKGDWNPFVVTRDYKDKRINVALSENDTIHHVQGLG